MKKYTLIGLLILAITNAVVLAGAAYNRTEATSQIKLTERELPLVYVNRLINENSTLSLRLNWRMPQQTKLYKHYVAHSQILTREALDNLGFDSSKIKTTYGNESRELYWALEFEGELHKQAIDNAQRHLTEVTDIYEDQPNRKNNDIKKSAQHSLNQEMYNRSRLFFKEISHSLPQLTAKYTDNNNIIIVKGLVKPQYSIKKDQYKITLKNLVVPSVMVPFEYSSQLKTLPYKSKNETERTRYTVNVSWGVKLEPWITKVSLIQPLIPQNKTGLDLL